MDAGSTRTLCETRSELTHALLVCMYPFSCKSAIFFFTLYPDEDRERRVTGSCCWQQIGRLLGEIFDGKSGRLSLRDASSKLISRPEERKEEEDDDDENLSEDGFGRGARCS